MRRLSVVLLLLCLTAAPELGVCGNKCADSGTGDRLADETRRIPAEWETQAGVWMQWPKGVESSYRPDFCRIIDVLQEYETVHIIVLSGSAESQAKNYLTNRGVPLTNLEWHRIDYNAAWMRDNGPVWVSIDNEVVVQDWGFDAWGGQYPPWDDDDAVPCQVADIVGAPCEVYDLITERGNLEFNGAGALISSWVCQSDRNPGVSQTEMEALFADAFGVDEIVWLLSAPSSDLTGGHVDGIARFIDEETVAVVRYVDQDDPDAWIYEQAATIIEDAGFTVERIDMPGYVNYSGSQMAAIYVNWLVVEEAVVVTGFGVPAWDSAAQARIEEFFPGRDVHVVGTLEIWYYGGGVHCVTNDQPYVDPTSVSEDLAAGAVARILPGQAGLSGRGVRLSFDVERTGRAVLEVVDVTGRRVTVLLDAVVTAGVHDLDWDGRDDAGRELPPGVYFTRLAFEGELDSGRAILLR